MSAPTILSDRLKALLKKLQISDGELRQQLGEFSGASFSNAVSGRLSPNGPVYPRLMAAIERYADAQQPKLDLVRLVKEFGPASTRPATSNDRILNGLRGAWFMIQYRGKREVVKDEPADPDLRIAVIVFASKGSDSSKRDFEVIGQTTLWKGEVYSHSQDKLLYYSAIERQREDIDERFDLITHHPFTQGKVSFQAGIVLGIGRGDFNASAVPVYASHTTLWRIENPHETGLSSPLGEPEVEHLRNYCGYIPQREVDAAVAARETEPLLLQRQAAIRKFLQKRISNCGDRLFVER
jgi:hypothetical protein